MDEHDLWTLAYTDLGPAGDARPVAEVLRRGQRLKQRRQMGRALGGTALAVGVAAAGVAVRPGPTADVTVEEAVERRLAERQGIPPSFLGCMGTFPTTDPLPEDTDGLRFLPAWLPDGYVIDPTQSVDMGNGSFVSTGQSVHQTEWHCRHSDPALVLRATGGDDTVEAGIRVEGPYPAPIEFPDEGSASSYVREPTELRGVSAVRVSWDFSGLIAFTWTEPDGAVWWIETTGADEATLRTVAEALVLDPIASPGTPAADVPASGIPPGFAVVWQASGLPKIGDQLVTTWSATFDGGGCHVNFETDHLEAPAGLRAATAGGGPGSVEVDVRGQPGLVIEHPAPKPQDGRSIVWREAPGVIGTVGCNNGIGPIPDPDLDAETLRRIAESLEPVAFDDPRFGPEPWHTLRERLVPPGGA